jgi:hypothetical protein
MTPSYRVRFAPDSVRIASFQQASDHREVIHRPANLDLLRIGSVADYRRAAGYVDRILKGEKSSDLPVRTPSKYQLIINFSRRRTLTTAIKKYTYVARSSTCQADSWLDALVRSCPESRLSLALQYLPFRSNRPIDDGSPLPPQHRRTDQAALAKSSCTDFSNARSFCTLGRIFMRSKCATQFLNPERSISNCRARRWHQKKCASGAVK